MRCSAPEFTDLPEGRRLELIRAINGWFPLADVVSVDLPSGLDSDSGVPPGETVHASHT